MSSSVPDPADLTAFLREQLDARAATAEEVQKTHPGPWTYDPREYAYVRDSNNHVVMYDEGALYPAGAEFIASNDPARVLRDITAARAILDLHKPVKFTDVTLGIVDATVCCTCHARLDYPDTFTDEQADAWEYPNVQVPWPCPTVSALLQPFRGVPGWRNEWAIED